MCRPAWFTWANRYQDVPSTVDLRSNLWTYRPIHRTLGAPRMNRVLTSGAWTTLYTQWGMMCTADAQSQAQVSMIPPEVKPSCPHCYQLPFILQLTTCWLLNRPEMALYVLCALKEWDTRGIRTSRHQALNNWCHRSCTVALSTRGAQIHGQNAPVDRCNGFSALADSFQKVALYCRAKAHQGTYTQLLGPTQVESDRSIIRC